MQHCKPAARPTLAGCSPSNGALRPSRRTAMGGLLAAGTIAALLAPAQASAFTVTETPLTSLGFVPEREGVVPWRLLRSVDAAARQPLFPQELRELHGQTVLLNGHLLPLSDGDEQREFLLAPFRAHCPFCIPGGAASFVAVRAQRAIKVTDQPILLTGTFRLTGRDSSGLLFRIDKATAVA